LLLSDAPDLITQQQSPHTYGCMHTADLGYPMPRSPLLLLLLLLLRRHARQPWHARPPAAL
jgi:hypothetical protein